MPVWSKWAFRPFCKYPTPVYTDSHEAVLIIGPDPNSEIQTLGKTLLL